MYMVPRKRWESFLENLKGGNEKGIEKFFCEYHEELEYMPRLAWEEFDGAKNVLRSKSPSTESPYSFDPVNRMLSNIFYKKQLDVKRWEKIQRLWSPRIFQDIIIALGKNDQQVLERLIPSMLPVRNCRRNHDIYHGISPNNSSVEEYVSRLESILNTGLIPTRASGYRNSTPEIPAVYFATQSPLGVPWGSLIVVTQTALLKESVFCGGIENPFAHGCENTFEHLVYSFNPVVPSEPFRVGLRIRIFSYGKCTDKESEFTRQLEQFVNVLERRRIHYTVFPEDSLLPYNQLKA